MDVGEFFNVANRQNRFVSAANQNAFAAAYNQTTDRYTFARTSTFGLVNSYLTSSDPRQILVAVKLSFQADNRTGTVGRVTCRRGSSRAQRREPGTWRRMARFAVSARHHCP